MTQPKAKHLDAAARLAAVAFQKYEGALHRYVLRRLRRPQAAPDITQDIFERFLKVNRADAIRNPQAYLFGIAAHVLSEAHYHQQHDPVTYDSELLEKRTELAGGGSPDELTDKLAMQRDLLDALKALPDNHLIAVLLVKGEGLSYEEAARAAGFTESTIGTYVTHARAKLKLMLEDYYSGTESPP